MSSAAEKFIRLYEDLVDEVNRRAGAAPSHSFEIERAAARDGAVRKHERLLKYIRDVRHALQHPRHQSPGHAVTISEAFFEEVGGLLSHLRNPPTAGSVGVPRRDIRTASLSDRIGDLADEMRRGGFSHLPIVDAGDIVIGVFNQAAVFNHLWLETETIIGRAMPVSEIFLHCRLDAEHTETFRFVSPRVPMEALADMFSAVQSPTTRLGAVIVTASGKETDPLQRLITPWDVLSIVSDR